MVNTLSVQQLGLGLETPNTPLPSSPTYRPPSWPPPREWVCIEDSKGNPVSRWGDSIWNLWPWADKNLLLNYGDGAKPAINSVVIDKKNADLFRLAMTWRIWGFRGVKSANTIFNIFKKLKVVFSTCSKHGILATDINRYPNVIEQLAKAIAPSQYSQTITELDSLLGASHLIGFTLLDASSIARLKASQPHHNYKQTVYIPPRIWQYQVKRLKEFIDDYHLHQQKIEECFAFCLEAYLENDFEECHKKGQNNRKFRPFGGKNRINGGPVFYGPFSETAKRFGLDSLLNKWVGDLGGGAQGIGRLSTYLSMASYVGLAYTLNFTLARITEGCSLRYNCLIKHDDPVYGPIPLIQGMSTKTLKDDTALWITSPSVEQAIVTMQSVAKMRSSFIPLNGSKNIFLMNHAQEPWKGGRKPNLQVKLSSVLSYANLIATYPLLFEREKILISEDDFKIALSVNPTLDQNIYQIGKPWSFSWHQLRRTGAVNMFSSGEISDSSIQIQLKHLSRLMSLSYGRGHTSINLSEDVRNIIINAQYEAMGRKLAELNSDRFVSPFGESQKDRLLSEAIPLNAVNLISELDANHYERAARNHQINFRRTAIGGCMKNGRCDGDGFSAVSDCAGSNEKSPCANAIFDRKQELNIKIRLEMVLKQIESTQPDTPRYRHLEQERRGLENFFVFTK